MGFFGFYVGFYLYGSKNKHIMLYVSRKSPHLSPHSVSVWGNSVQNLSEHLGFVTCPVQNFREGVRKETVFSKESINCWLKSRSLNTNLEG